MGRLKQILANGIITGKIRLQRELIDANINYVFPSGNREVALILKNNDQNHFDKRHLLSPGQLLQVKKVEPN